MANKRIFLAGERCIDIDVIGSCDRLAAEAPCIIQKPAKTAFNEGMAGNVKRNIESLAPGTKIDFFHQPNPIYKIRHIDSASGYILLRVDDNDDAYDPDIWTKMIEGMAQNSDGYSHFVISDYGKNLLREEVIKNLTDIAHEIGAVVWLDSRKPLGDWSKDIDYVKINEKEYQANLAAGVKEPWNWCRNLIVTRGKDGADLYNQTGQVIYRSPSRAGRVFNVSGAGDTFFAALVVQYSQNGGSIQDAMNYASIAAAVAVSKPGVVAVSHEEVEHV